jgi:predicted nucleotidyltransferase
MKAAVVRQAAPEPADPQWATLADILGVLDREGIDHALIGGHAVAIHGRPRYSRDLDLLVRHVDAMRALEAAGRAGFETDPINPHWLYKAFKNGVQVDLLFKTKGDIYYDDEMVERTRRVTFQGIDVPVIAPEDLVVIKALVHDEETPRHWWDALSILTRQELDWSYLAKRASQDATSLGILVPAAAVHDLAATVSAAGKP